MIKYHHNVVILLFIWISSNNQDCGGVSTPEGIELYNVWQFRIEIKYSLVMYFELITKFDTL